MYKQINISIKDLYEHVAIKVKEKDANITYGEITIWFRHAVDKYYKRSIEVGQCNTLDDFVNIVTKEILYESAQHNKKLKKLFMKNSRWLFKVID